MKFIIILCVVLVGVSALKQDLFKLSPESSSKLIKIAEPCAQEFNVDPANIKKLGDSTLPRDEANNKFLHCFAVNSGFVDQDGHIVPERVALIVRDHPRNEEFKEAMKKCSKITKENPIATTVAQHMCYGENSPILFQYVQ